MLGNFRKSTHQCKVKIKTQNKGNGKNIAKGNYFILVWNFWIYKEQELQIKYRISKSIQRILKSQNNNNMAKFMNLGKLETITQLWKIAKFLVKHKKRQNPMKAKNGNQGFIRD